jgi:hypothetical protein
MRFLESRSGATRTEYTLIAAGMGLAFAARPIEPASRSSRTGRGRQPILDSLAGELLLGTCVPRRPLAGKIAVATDM